MASRLRLLQLYIIFGECSPQSHGLSHGFWLAYGFLWLRPGLMEKPARNSSSRAKAMAFRPSRAMATTINSAHFMLYQ